MKFLLWIFWFTIVIEVGSLVVSEAGILNINQPSYDFSQTHSRFWQDINEYFGVWHYPHSRYRHRRECYDVEYTANSYGARDKERAKHSSEKRVVVLGDSMIEGIGVQSQERVSDLLEEHTGIPHLNFSAAGHFGTIQYWLLYRHLAKSFAHDAVIIGILPDNDFLDDDYQVGKNNFSNRYRPYLVGEHPDFELVYHVEQLPEPETSRQLMKQAKAILREYSYTYHALSYSKAVLSDDKHSIQQYSGYYDFSGTQWDIMRYTLSQIVKEAEGKEVLVFSIPRIRDLRRFATDKAPPLTSRLQDLAQELGFQYTDLLLPLSRGTLEWEKYYLPCDGHLSIYGNKIIAEILHDKLQLYSSLEDQM